MTNKEPEYEEYGKRKITIDNTNPWNLGLIDKYEDTSLNSILESKAKPKDLRKQFIEELKKHSKEGKDLFTYRAIKQALMEMELQASDLAPKVNMTVNEFKSKVNKAMKEIDEHIADGKTIMYETALNLLADDEGFHELERLKIAYDKAMETNYLLAAVEEQKQLENHKVNLLDILRKDNTNE